MRLFKKENRALLILWALFISAMGLVLYYVFVHLTVKGGQPPLAGLFSNQPLFILAATIGMSLIFTHAWIGLGMWRGTLFVLLAFALGLAAEIAGVKTGLIFGGRYDYAVGTTPVFMGVPLLIPIFWTAFISVGYGLVGSFLVLLGRGKPDKDNSGTIRLLLAVTLDSLAVVAIDLIMDPLQVAAGNWRWLEPGGFYGVPWGNFTGWFLVVALTTGIFRTVEYYFPGERRATTAAPLVSAISYALLGLVLGAFALKSGMLWLSLVGLGVMLPLALASLYGSWKKAALWSSSGAPAKNEHQRGR